MIARYRAGKRLWEPEDEAQLVARYPHESTSVIARDLRRSLQATYARAQILGLEKSAKYRESPAACRLRRGDNVGAPSRFKKGHVPANKGLRRPGWSSGRMRENQFKAGQAGYNWKPVGSERLIDGYRYTKISDRRRVCWTVNWKPTHVVLWEK